MTLVGTVDINFDIMYTADFFYSVKLVLPENFQFKKIILNTTLNVIKLNYV